ncbi:NADPH dependent oxidoreductase, putative [Theileria annulata]|uniref:NADPH dependent oxidoreductase, putative n=1 Tax=Theileria annulata TaxID=5874 RepID=Q4UFK5_THEAN|nr:NADPH dependent oxidoreductase, putative [Theileria annulata]CAI74111.1 NADPH dependent oxidoreductase, putative [Theileria annulata]|eukprot:XP_951843.1 NADPH dependent oxidoreductase, putative [Theileria annulata]
MRYVKFGIIGTGPSGLYLGKYLSKNIKNCKIDFFEKSKQLLGLFKNGVAPDKINIKNNSYQLLINHHYRFFTNIHIGKDLKLEKLLEYYNAIFICCGCEDCNEYQILNEQIGVFNSLNLIHFYNHFPINNTIYHNLPIFHINKYNTTTEENYIAAPKVSTTEGKGANSTLTECTSGKGANFTATECTGEKNLNEIAAVTKTRESSTFSLDSKDTNSKGITTVGTTSTTTIGPTTVTEENNIAAPKVLTGPEGTRFESHSSNSTTESTSTVGASTVTEKNPTKLAAPIITPVSTVTIEEYMEYLIGLKKVNISIIGNGNVSLDIIRMLTKSEEELENLEINPKFKYFIKNLNINKITIFGRNSLINSKFTNNELQLIFNNNFHIQHNLQDNLINLINNLENNIKNRKIIKKLKLFNSINNLNTIDQNLEDLENNNLDLKKNKCIIDFKFNTKIIKIINNNNIINSILYTHTQENPNTQFAANNSTIENLIAATRENPIGQFAALEENLNAATVENPSTHIAAVKKLDSNILIKCIGYNNKSNVELIKLIDNKRIFGNGWIINNCKGDLSNIILNSIQLSNQIKIIFKQFHYFNNDILNYFKLHHFI